MAARASWVRSAECVPTIIARYELRSAARRPARASSAPLVGQHATLGIDMAPHMPTDPANSARTFLFNYEWWADYRDDMDARFQAWLSQ